MRRVTPDFELTLTVCAVIAAGLLTPSFGPGFAIADLFIFALILLWFPKAVHGEPYRVLGAVTVPLMLILLGSVLGTMTVGAQSWIVRDLVKDVGAFASFLAVVAVLQRRGSPALRAVGIAAAVGTIIVSAMLLSEGQLRAQAGFPNPNLAGHFLATNLLVLARAPVPRWLRLAASALCVAALVAVGSFGALIMVVGGFAYLTSTAPATPRMRMIRRVAPVALVVGLLVVMTNLPETTGETGFNANHFERSSQGRLTRWSDTLEVAATYPTGIGPGSNRGLGLLPHQQEAHNEYLAYLTERGIIGLAGLVLLYAALWRLGARGGVTRALIIGFALQSMVRETLHYRHLWLLLAFAIVLDATRARAGPDRATVRVPVGAS